MSAPTAARKNGRPVRAMNSGRGALAYGALGLAVFMTAWCLGTVLMGAETLPSPIAVLVRFVELLHEPLAGQTLVGHAWASLQRWTGGFLVAAAIGLPLGYAFAWWPSVRSAFLPAFEVLRYIPPFAWIPLAILWFGPGYLAQMAVVFVAVVPAVVLNAEVGIRTIDPLLTRAARTLGTRRLSTLTRIAIPTTAPAAVTGLRIGVGNGWMALMGAELIVGRSGLGYVILSGQQSGQAVTVIAGMAAIGLIGVAMDRVIVTATNPVTRWRKETEDR